MKKYIKQKFCTLKVKDESHIDIYIDAAVKLSASSALLLRPLPQVHCCSEQCISVQCSADSSAWFISRVISNKSHMRTGAPPNTIKEPDAVACRVRCTLSRKTFTQAHKMQWG